jgi:L-arabinose isomerase
VEAQRIFGWSIQAHGINDLVELVDEVPPDAVDRLVAEYASAYELAPELRGDGARTASLRDAAQIELGLREFLARGQFSAFTTNFEDLGGLRQLPGIGPQRLMAEGYGFGAEGDWKTAALLRVMNVMSQGRPGGTSFMEDYTYHFGPGEPKLLGSHMLEISPSIAAATPRCEVHPLSIGDREDPVRLVFEAEPGSGLVVGILDLGDRFRLVANEIEIVEPDGPLPKLPVASATWKPAPSLATSAECWITAGGPHHTVLSTAVDRESLDDFARIAGVELAWIDSSSTTAQFARELQWSEAYYRGGRR